MGGFLACVIELGETGNSLKPARCDDTTGDHANHFLLGPWGERPQFPHRADGRGDEEAGKQGDRARRQVARFGRFWLGLPLNPEPLTAQIGLYSIILHRLHPLFGPVRGASSVSGHPVMGGNGARRPGGNLGFSGF